MGPTLRTLFPRWAVANRFAILSLLCVIALAVVMGYVMSTLLVKAVSDWEWENTAVYVRYEVDVLDLGPLFTAPQTVQARRRWERELPRLFQGVPEIFRVKVWDREARVLWSDEPRLIGQRFPDNDALRDALGGRVGVEMKTARARENVYEGGTDVIAEVYVPIFAAGDGRQVIGVVELYKRPRRLLTTIGWARLVVWTISMAGGLSIYAILLPLLKTVYARQARERALVEYADQLESAVAARTTELVRASRAKSEFLASMSHELRTPLNAIIGFANVLLRRQHGDLTEQQTAFVAAVRQSGTHLLQLINNMLDVSQIEAGRLVLELSDVEVKALVDECVEVATSLIRDRPVTVEASVEPQVGRIRADRVKLKQIVLNLLSNAIKFTPRGRVIVSVRAEPAGTHWSVQDSGVGILPADVGRLFRPFERLGPDAGGTGLGLALCKQLVELHGGTIGVESRPQAGSTFSFTLPTR